MALGAEAARRGMSPQELAYEWMLKDDGKALILFPFLNYVDDSLDPALQMMRHANTVLGLGDGGAHCGMICDRSFPTSMLTHWTRDRTRGEKLPIGWVVKAQTRETAEAVGLLDRGVIAPGYKADLNIIDYGRLTLHRPGSPTIFRRAANGWCSGRTAIPRPSSAAFPSTGTDRQRALCPASSCAGTGVPGLRRRQRPDAAQEQRGREIEAALGSIRSRMSIRSPISKATPTIDAIR